MTDTVLVEISGGVATVTMNRPEARNALNTELRLGLPATLAELDGRDDVVVARDELSIPPTVTAAQAKGFSLWALRTVLSGRGDEILDLADTNVFRRIFS